MRAIRIHILNELHAMHEHCAQNGHSRYRCALAIVNVSMINHYTAIKIDINMRICLMSNTPSKFDVSIKRAPATHKTSECLIRSLLLMQTLDFDYMDGLLAKA